MKKTIKVFALFEIKFKSTNSVFIFYALFLLLNTYTFGQTITVQDENQKNSTLILKGDRKVYLDGTPQRVVAENVDILGTDNGRVTDTTSGNGKEDIVAFIKRSNEKAKVFLNGNFNTDYLKQKFNRNGVNWNLFGKEVFNGTQKLLDNCDILRNENGYTLAHCFDGTIKLYLNNKWIDINQIITVNGFTYYIQKDNSNVYKLDGSTATEFGKDASLLQDNNNQLIKIDKQKNYSIYESGWMTLYPKYTSVSPEIVDEGFCFFIQPKSLLNSSNTIDHRKGLAKNVVTGKLEVDTIPSTGNCDRFLWKTYNSFANKLLINKADGSPLRLNDDNTLTFDNKTVDNNGNLNWEFSNALTKANYGTNAYQITGKNQKSLSYKLGQISTKNKSIDDKDLEQIWVFQFNQMEKGYFLPMPTDDNLKKYFYADNDTIFYKLSDLSNGNVLKLNLNEIQNLKKQMKDSSKAIQKSYNKFLRGINGVNFFATNTTSDWAIVNYYFVLNNVMNAVKKPKPNYSGVNSFDLSAMNGRNITIINKNDLSASSATYFFSKYSGKNEPYISNYRGGGNWLNPFGSDILTSEELTCKKGIVNRPLDNSFRRFDHGIHEFAHALQGLGGWSDVLRKMVNDSLIANIDTSKVKNIKNSFCWDFTDNINNESPECICWMIQKWFNSSGNQEYYPTNRTDNNLQQKFMEIIFNKENTWMPPKDIRQDGYLPSGTFNPYASNAYFLSDSIQINFPKDIKNLGNILNQSYTKSAWVKIKQTTGSKNNILSGNEASAQHAFWIPSEYGFRLAAGHNRKWDLVKSPSPLQPNKWYHVAVTYNSYSKIMAIYIDGVRVNKSENVEPFSKTNNNLVSIGGYDGANNFDGQMKIVSISNYALSDIEIKNLYEYQINNPTNK